MDDPSSPDQMRLILKTPPPETVSPSDIEAAQRVLMTLQTARASVLDVLQQWPSIPWIPSGLRSQLRGTEISLMAAGNEIERRIDIARRRLQVKPPDSGDCEPA